LSTATKPYDMSDDLTRRKIFWLLKRLTSYSLWQRKAQAWRVFTQAYEQAVKSWPEGPEVMDADLLPRIYQMASAYEEGLDQLKRGYRFVWRQGEVFNQTIRIYNGLTRVFYRGDGWEHGIQMAPYPPKVEALHRLMVASEYHGEWSANEVPYRPDTWAHWKSPSSLLNRKAYQFNFYELAYPVFPDLLPEVPRGAGVTIQSGDRVPLDGIWEPVETLASKASGLNLQDGTGGGPLACYNYLVKETQAPNLLYVSAGLRDGVRGVAVEWRLIWEDTRYRNGEIPDESEYFLSPKADRKGVTPLSGDPVEVTTGSVCPVSGTWTALGYDAPPITMREGDTMPDLVMDKGQGERRVHWVTWSLLGRS
jgi:hypothetical protein